MKRFARKTASTVWRMSPGVMVQARRHRRTIIRFAERVGMVYFGYVNQKDDEHRLIRGLTVSSNHRDNHYCIGSFEGYDITFVERTDLLQRQNGSVREHSWLIMSFDLHKRVDLPHIFMGLHTHDEAFYARLFTRFSTFSKLHFGTFGEPNAEFLKKYQVYAPIAQAISAERIFNPAMTKAIVEHFGTLTFEIADEVLYVYAEHHSPSAALLERMIKNGLWLARYLDSETSQ